MLLALAKKLRSQVPSDQQAANLPVGTLTFSQPYPQLRYGDIEGVGLVSIDQTGNMIGFSPVERCKDKHGEIAWIPTELVKNLRLEPFAVTERTTRSTKTAT
jgi:hypothetical protein